MQPHYACKMPMLIHVNDFYHMSDGNNDHSAFLSDAMLIRKIHVAVYARYETDANKNIVYHLGTRWPIVTQVCLSEHAANNEN